MKALVLLAHGSREAGGPRPLAEIRDWVQAQSPGTQVLDAYLTLNQPSLRDSLFNLARSGVQEAVVVPLFVSRGHHLNVELPALLADLQKELPALRLALSPHLGADEGLAALVLTRAAQAQPLPGDTGATLRLVVK